MLIVSALSLWIYSLVSASLPQLSGQVALHGLQDKVAVARDPLGVVTIAGQSRLDVARATGFVHAQDRFFQMDLLRRKAAGELAALLGPSVYEVDVAYRRHNFRSLAKQVITSSEQQMMIQAYSDGVNQGLQALQEKPFEYLLLQTEPEPWRPEDSVLVVYAMYLELQGHAYKQDALFGAMQRHLTPAMLSFLSPRGTPWDAPVDGSQLPLGLIPMQVTQSSNDEWVQVQLSEPLKESAQVGSNSWAVSGALSLHGGALLAGDMHLGLNVPNIWYRLKLDWLDGDERASVSGVSLPGLPFVIVGSNGHLAWSFTNSYGDFQDLVELELDPQNPHNYKTNEGWRTFETKTALIQVRGEEARQETYHWSQWGPVISPLDENPVHVLRWMAHAVEATNLSLVNMERAHTLAQGLAVAQQTGTPVQNMLLVDSHGGLAWTLMGRLPQRTAAVDSRFPVPWAMMGAASFSWLPIEEYPQIINPQAGRLWNGNARMVGGEMLSKLGDGGYALGARAKQIQQRLQAKESFAESDFLEIQLDDRAIFLAPWQAVLTKVLADQSLSADTERDSFRALILQWDGSASVDSVSYRLVRAFRLFLAQRVFEMLLQPVLQQQPDANYLDFAKYEGPLWQLVQAEPAHLLSADYENWQALYLSVVDEVIDYFKQQDIPLSQASWGARNTLQVQHPLAKAIPGLGYFLNMPSEPLPGDQYMPRVQDTSFGASQRMVVSPGYEHLGYMHMPVGQSGHPLSSFYSAGHDDWVKGRPSAFLPGETVYTLELSPE